MTNIMGLSRRGGWRWLTSWYSVLSHVWYFHDPMDCSRPGSSVNGILQARILEWVAVPSSRGSSWPRDRTLPFMSLASAGSFFAPEAPEAPFYTWQCTDVSATLSVQCTLPFPCRAHKSIPHPHSCGHSFLTLTQKREQLPSPSQGISATPILSVKGTEVLGVRSLWFHPLSKTQTQTRSASSYCVET